MQGKRRKEKDERKTSPSKQLCSICALELYLRREGKFILTISLLQGWMLYTYGRVVVRRLVYGPGGFGYCVKPKEQNRDKVINKKHLKELCLHLGLRVVIKS